MREGLRFDKYLVATSCRQCRDPLCMVGCPVGSIRRRNSLEIIIEESLIVVTFATLVLTVYVFGIRRIGDWMTQSYGVRPGLVEALLIVINLWWEEQRGRFRRKPAEEHTGK